MGVEAVDDDRAVLVQCAVERAPIARLLLSRACRATGLAVRLEVLGGTGTLFHSLFGAQYWSGPDLILSGGPYMAMIAVRSELLLEPYQPAAWPPEGMSDRVAQAARHPEWYWVALDFSPFIATGEPRVDDFGALDGEGLPRLAFPDPMRSEVGHLALLASHHRADQLGYDAWEWWDRRVERGLVLTEDFAAALSTVQEGLASHALGLPGPETGGIPVALLRGLAPVPNAAALVRSSSRPEQARLLLDWLAGPEASELIDGSGQGVLSARGAATNGLRSIMETAPPLDLEWATERFLSVRQRWAEEKRYSEWPFEAR